MGLGWKPGNKIHFVINNRTKNRFQFAPVITVKSVQEIEIKKIEGSSFFEVLINNRYLRKKEIDELAQNDGFPSIGTFFDFFNSNFTGKIIHWTNIQY